MSQPSVDLTRLFISFLFSEQPFQSFQFPTNSRTLSEKKKHGTIGMKRTYKIVKLPSINWLVFSWQVHSCLVWVQLVRVGFPLKSPQIQTWYSMASVRTSRILNEIIIMNWARVLLLQRNWNVSDQRIFPVVDRESHRERKLAKYIWIVEGIWQEVVGVG